MVKSYIVPRMGTQGANEPRDWNFSLHLGGLRPPPSLRDSSMNMKKLVPLMAALVAIGGLQGCSSKEKASDSTLTRAIDKYSKTHRSCVEMSPVLDDMRGQDARFGNDVIMIPLENAKGDSINKMALKQMKILVDEGIYKKSSGEVPDAGNGGQRVKAGFFELTPKGKKFFIRHDDHVLTCLGEQKVKKINFFTKPAAYQGFYMTLVDYEANVKIDPWGKEIIKLDPNHELYDRILVDYQHLQTTLILTNKGWMDARVLDE